MKQKSDPFNTFLAIVALLILVAVLDDGDAEQAKQDRAAYCATIKDQQFPDHDKVYAHYCQEKKNGDR